MATVIPCPPARRRFVKALFLAGVGAFSGCSNFASLGVGFTLDPLGVQVTYKTALAGPSITSDQLTIPAATSPAVLSTGSVATTP
jgi:hypothetical protein